jgi:hypothetical protein
VINSKHEIRNTKQIQNSNKSNAPNNFVSVILILDFPCLFRISVFDIRAYVLN